MAPFRFEKMWLEEPHFEDLIREWWREIMVEDWAGFRLAGKLKLLKVEKSRTGLVFILERLVLSRRGFLQK